MAVSARRDAAESTPTSTSTESRLTATSLLLVGLAMIQSSGRLVADTKIDLVVAPWRMLGRSLSMWDPIGVFGQVGNQAYGYLWPMGPFFGVLESLAVPPWIVQRLWMALVLVVAFQGAARLARALGVRSDVALILAGLAYALSPRLLTTVGPISIEAWPSALAPWVLLCLVHGSRHGSARRYAAGAALAVAMVGGVNAAATFAVIPLGAIWLLTRAPGPRRRTLMLWWPLATFLACLWWMVPLILLGTYSPPFLEYIETADLTTYPATVFDALRGTSAWIPYLDPRWQSGGLLIRTPAVIATGGVVMALGFLGIARRGGEHRPFLLLGLMTGLLMVTAGHLGAVQGWFAEDVHRALDGVLAPFRNAHKFDPVIRLPLVLGLGLLADASMQAWRRPEWRTRAVLIPQRALVVVAALALVGATTPVLTGRVAPTRSFTEVPTYWSDAAAWLGDRDSDQRALLVPASSFADYVWGDTRDEPLQPLATSPWGVRSAIPLAPVGHIRALDAVEERIDRGEASDGLVAYLRRLGVRYLVVRNDLQRSSRITHPALVHQVLDESPGIRRVASFGPPVGGDAQVETPEGSLAIESGWQTRYDAVEIFEVAGTVPAAVTAAEVPVVLGAPEDLLTLAERDVLDDQPTVLAVDADRDAAPPGPVILTDGNRLRDRFLGAVHDAASPTLTSAEADALGKASRDYEIGGGRLWKTEAVLDGAESVVASSSASASDYAGGARTANLPHAALDGDPATSWVSGPPGSDPTTFRVTYPGPVDLTYVMVTTAPDPDVSRTLTVRTEQGASDPVTLAPGTAVRVPVPSGATDWVEVSEPGGAEQPLAISELDVPGTRVRRWLRPPAVPEAWGAPAAISLDADADTRSGCVTILAALRCAPQAARIGGEETAGMRRLVDVPEGADYRVQVRALPRSGDRMPDLLQAGRLSRVETSSQANSTVAAASGLAAVDGDPGTTWISASTDPEPSLDLQWLRERLVSGLRLEVEPGAAARRPTQVLVSYPGGTQQVELDADGRGTMAPIQTDRLSISVDRSSNTANIEADQTFTSVGVGISELTLDGVPEITVAPSDEVVERGCGSGPDLVDPAGMVRPTAVLGSERDLYLGRPVDLRVCGDGDGDDVLRLEPGENRLELLADDDFAPLSMVLTRTADGEDDPDGLAALAGPERAAAVDGSGWEPEDDDARLLVTRHNENAGWAARRDGEALEPVVVDGWQQGYWLSSDDAASADGPGGPVTVEYRPEAWYRAGLAGGGAALLVLLLLWLRWRRRAPGADDPPLVPARSARWVAGLATVPVAGLVAGWWGAGIVVVAGAGLWLLRSRGMSAWWPAMVPVAVAASWYAVQPWGSPRGWAGADAIPQLLMIVPLALLGVSTLADGRPWRRR